MQSGGSVYAFRHDRLFTAFHICYGEIMSKAELLSLDHRRNGHHVVVNFIQNVRQRYLILMDFLLLNLSYWSMHWLSGKQATDLMPFLKLWGVIVVLWAFQSLQYERFERLKREPLLVNLKKLAVQAIYMVYATAVLLVLLRLTAFTPYHVFGTFALMFVLESTALAAYKGLELGSLKRALAQRQQRRRPRQPLHVFAIDFVLFLAAFFTVHLLKYDTLNLVDRAPQALLVLSASWLITAKWTGKFRYVPETNISYALSPYIKSFYIGVGIMSVIIYAWGLFSYSRTLIFGTCLLLFVLEVPVAVWRTLKRRRDTAPADIETVDEVRKFIRQHELPFDRNGVLVQTPADAVLRESYLKNVPGVYAYVQQHVPLQDIDKSHVQVLDTHTLYNVETLEQQSLQMFVNLHKINEMRWLNQYFLQVHSKLRTGGYFVIRKERLENYREGLERKFPKPLATGMYVMHFLWHRVLPKLAGFNQIYFTLSRGKNRVITRAELIGRLHFCGFQLVSYEQVGKSHWFIARKLKMPVLDRNPNLGPLIKLPRVGYQGRVFHLYKFRTMHPYAEYLQDFVYQQNQLDTSGKFKNDFRLTQWGKVMRKYWLDELPQLINYVRGDIRLFGVRALSQHYYSLYPEDVQHMRIQHKPGLVPPYYADMPGEWEEIVESERRYLQQKAAAPLKTDVVYFSRAMYNIVFKKAHSG